MVTTIRTSNGICSYIIYFFMALVLLLTFYFRDFLLTKDKPYELSIWPIFRSTNSRYLNEIKIEFKSRAFRRILIPDDKGLVEVYIHDKYWILNEIAIKDDWESDEMQQFKLYIKLNPGIQVMDVGCSVGIYTLNAASLGSPVVAIDADWRNTDRLAQSVFVNGFEDKVKIYSNVLSNERKKYNLISAEIGGRTIVDCQNMKVGIQGIIVDDLIELFDKDRPIVIKVAFKGNEIALFKNATRLFKELYVKSVIIEWFWIKSNPEIQGLIDFLLLQNFKPYDAFF